jgi:hypothetical protein
MDTEGETLKHLPSVDRSMVMTQGPRTGSAPTSAGVPAATGEVRGEKTEGLPAGALFLVSPGRARQGSPWFELRADTERGTGGSPMLEG